MVMDDWWFSQVGIIERLYRYVMVTRPLQLWSRIEQRKMYSCLKLSIFMNTRINIYFLQFVDLMDRLWLSVVAINFWSSLIIFVPLYLPFIISIQILSSLSIFQPFYPHFIFSIYFRSYLSIFDPLGPPSLFQNGEQRAKFQGNASKTKDRVC
jgi:hypothetical protein